MSDLDQLSNALGYTEAEENWVRLADDGFDPATSYLNRSARAAGATHAYVFHTCPKDMPMLPDRPAIYVASAPNETAADEIHRKLWLLGNAPFILVVLPEHVRIYTGFNYKRGNTKDHDGLIEPSVPLASISQALLQFGAEEVNSGRIWERQAKHLKAENRVDRRLLKNLEELGNELVGVRKLNVETAHNLIGKYLYIRYLWDRGILSLSWIERRNLSYDQVLGRNATLDGLRRLTEALEARFNGDIFPLPLSGADAPDDSTVAYVASVFKGDEAKGGQLALDFQVYDFSFIPVEVLSSIYEQFLRRQEHVRKVGAYYTPEPVADYLVSELNYVKPLRPGMVVLDPCCGSGVFLVLVYRRLIEMSLAYNHHEPLSPQELSDILVDSIFGVERNRDACYVTEFSLLLTLLSYVTPPDLDRHEGFKFPHLHDENIFACDFFDQHTLFWQRNRRFDWIIGNTPWMELDKLPSHGIDRDEPLRRWIEVARKENQPVNRGRVSDAFCWHAANALNNGGYVGLFIPAKTLTNEQCKPFRRAFFTQNTVHRITNFSNLAYILFAGRAEHPAATVIYTKGNNARNKPGIVHYGPFVVHQILDNARGRTNDQVWAITVYENDIQTVLPEEAETGEAIVWKTALWGNRRDRRVLPRLERLLPKTLGQLCRDERWNLRLGLQLRGTSSEEDTEAMPELEHYRMLDTIEMTASHFHFSVPSHVLHGIPEDKRFVRKGRRIGLQVANSPHLFLSVNFAAFSDQDFVLPHPQIGISCLPADADHLRAISVLLSSSLVRYLLFFRSTSWGILTSTIGKDEAESIPLPELDSEKVAQLAGLQRELTEREFQGAQSDEYLETLFADDMVKRVVPQHVGLELQDYLDVRVEQILRVPESLCHVAHDFMRVHYQFNKGKPGANATNTPTDIQLMEYGTMLARSLDAFVNVIHTKHSVDFVRVREAILCRIRYVDGEASIEPSVIDISGNTRAAYEDVWKSLRQQFSQWVYVQRSLRWFDGNTIWLLKSDRLMDWTRTQALLDSDDVIGEILTHHREAK